jgi:hypothetical protein
MRKSVVDLLARLSHRPASIRRRLFWLLWGMGLGILLVINLAWLPGALQDIRAAQSDLQRVAVRGVRDQLQLFLDDKEQALKNQARLSRPAFFQRDQEGLRLLAQRFFQREQAFEVSLGHATGGGIPIRRLCAAAHPPATARGHGPGQPGTGATQC